MEIDKNRINAIYDYVASETKPLQAADGAIVFGRADKRVIQRAAEIYEKGLTGYFVVTGGIGKDSGELAKIHGPVSEAHFIGIPLVMEYKVPGEKVYLDTLAKNGGECCRNSIDLIVKESLPHNSLTLLVHPTSLLRTQAVFEQSAKNKSFQVESYKRVGTRYSFNPEKPIDYKEAVAELLRIADWPDHKDKDGKPDPWASPQADLPHELIRYARDLDTSWKAK